MGMANWIVIQRLNDLIDLILSGQVPSLDSRLIP